MHGRRRSAAPGGLPEGARTDRLPRSRKQEGNAMSRLSRFVLAASIAGALPLTATADVVLSSNDGHTVMDAEGKLVAPNPVGAETVTVIDVSADPPAIKATFDAPGSVVGPPGAIWISPDESW